jgi:endonuclease/exonuclease/phosphatase family metal-dependent hydrolase
MVKALAAILVALSPLVSAVQFRLATYNIGAHYTADGYPDYSLSTPGTPDFDNVRAVLARINADVVALEEVASNDLSGSPSNLSALASSLGYPYIFYPLNPANGPPGPIDSTLRVVILSRYPFLSTDAVRSPEGAKEITRLLPAVRVDIPGTDKDPLIIAGHLKSGSAAADPFRRAVEFQRLTQYLATNHVTENDNFIVLGDFNLSDDYETFTAAPAGLPSTYQLGADITFPVTYHIDPLEYFSSLLPGRVDLRQVDGSRATYPTSSSAIDVMLISPAIDNRPLASEVYNSALDNAGGGGLAKAGAAPAAGTSTLASDHLAVFADLNLDSAPAYAFTAPGQTIVENFANFDGTYDPSPWTTSAPASWRGPDSGAVPTPGFRSYGPAENPSLGLVPQADTAATFTANFTNRSADVLTALEIKLTARQWRAVLNGTADHLTAQLVTSAGAVAIPALAFTPVTTLPTGAIANPVAVPLAGTLDGLAIAPGESFQLRFTDTPGPGGAAPPSAVFVNEFHYDNTSTDTGEFVEIAVAPGFTGKISDLKLYLYGGAVVYDQVHPLDTFTAGAITSSGHQLFSKFIPDLRNTVAGFAIVYRNQVLQFVSYEGAITATSGPANGLTSVATTVNQSTATAAGYNAIRLTGTGATAANFTWAKSTTVPHNPGAVNSGQTFTAPLQSQGIAIDDVSVKFLSNPALDSDGDGFTDSVETNLLLTDPHDPNSRFAAAIHPSAAGGNAAVTLEFPTLTGRSYVIEESTDLQTWADGPAFSGNGSLRAVDFPIVAAGPKKFYRVRVALE